MSTRLPISGPLGLGDLLDRAFRLYRARLGLFLMIAALFLVPFSLISGLLSGQFITNYMDAFVAIVAAEGSAPETIFSEALGSAGSFFVVMMGMAILSLVISGLVTLALNHSSIAVLHNQPISLAESMRGGLRRFGSFVWMSIVQFSGIALATLGMGIVIFIFVMVIIFIGAAVGSALLEGDNIFATIAVVLVALCGYFLAILLFLAPAIYLSARWLVATPAMLAENLGAMQSLRRSWALTKGHTWRAVGYVVLLYLITAIVVGLPVGLIQQLILLLLGTSSLGLATILSSAISSIFSVLWTPLYICAVVLLYYDLRVRVEGYDLALRIEQLENELRPPNGPEFETPAL